MSLANKYGYTCTGMHVVNKYGCVIGNDHYMGWVHRQSMSADKYGYIGSVLANKYGYIGSVLLANKYVYLGLYPTLTLNFMGLNIS